MICRRTLLSVLIAPTLCLASGTFSALHASGFAIFTQGASSTGQANAVTAHADGPSTLFFNPALMNRLDGTRIEVGTTALVVARRFEPSDPAGNSTSDHSVFFPSTLYLTHQFNDRFSAGLGVFNPFGLGTTWKDDWDGRYLATKSELTTFNINPAFSVKVLPQLSLAAGLDVIILDATLQRKIPGAALGLPLNSPDVNQKFKGSGTGFGYNLGMALDITKDLTLGAAYRSQVFAKLTGDSSTTLRVTPLDGNGSATIRLPQQVTAALAYRVTEPLTLEAGMRWEGWSSFRSLQLSLANGLSSVTPRDWHDTFAGNIGGRYRLNDQVALLAGYLYGTSPVPDSTFDPSIPDADTYVICAGTDLSVSGVNLGFSYGYQRYLNRTKTDNQASGGPSPLAANGTYHADAHLVSLSVGYKF